MRLIELTTDFPCMHFRADSMTFHFEESIISGSFAMSGSAMMRFTNFTIAFSESSIASSMQMSITWAPPSTWFRAMARASPYFSSFISRANLIEPETFVRSPILTKLVRGVMIRGSSPLSLVYLVISGITLGLYFFAFSAIMLIWSGVVPQQPPMILIHPSFMKSSVTEAMNSAVWSYSPNWFGRPAFGWAET